MKNNLRKVILLLLFAGAFLLLLAGCARDPLLPTEESGLMVVSTIFPLADIAGRLGGEHVNTSCLLPAGASPHTFEPSAEQARKISRAHLLLYIGRGLDDWAVKGASAGSDTLSLPALADSALQQGWQPQQKSEPIDPHLWLDPLTVRDYFCPTITEAMVDADPQNESFYRSNLEQYRQELSLLDEEISTSFSALPQNSFISLHAAWGHFAGRYGLDQAAVISDFPGREPSPAWIARLVDLCRQKGVGVVAAEPQLSPAVAEMIAREIGGRVILLDPLGGAGLTERGSYLDLMRYNTAVLVEAFAELAEEEEQQNK